MLGQQECTGPLFSSISTEDRIPASHPLRQVRQLADQALDSARAVTTGPRTAGDLQPAISLLCGSEPG